MNRQSRLVNSSSPYLKRLQQIFDEPPRDFSPTPIWWWSGEKLEIERLRWQLDRLAEGGVYNVVILNLAPVGPLYGKDADDPPFMAEEWWDIFLAVCAYASTLGIRIWFYDQVGFSGANFQGQLCVQDERCRGMILSSRIVDAANAEFPAESLPLAAFATGSGVPPHAWPLEGHRAAAGATGKIRLIYALRGGFDYFSKRACGMLLDRIHGEFERRAGQYFGNVIAGSFQDELPSMPTWGSDFARAFRDRAGYDLLPTLWALFEGETGEAQRVRFDYQRIRAELTEEAFFRPFNEWHQARGMICGCDQQGSSRSGHPIDCVRQYADYLRTHRWFGAPGSDHHGEARVHSSLAEHHGHRRVWVEAFHSTGWGGTLEETFDWLLPWWLAGGNLYNPHAVYYSTRGGWWEWAAPSTCWRQPYWRHYRAFSSAVSRVCAVLAETEHRCDVAILHPATTVQAFLTMEGPLPTAQTADEIYRALTGQMTWYAPQAGLLDKSRVDFSILDDAALQRGEIDGNRLAVGTASYSTLLLPGCVILEEPTIAQLEKFIAAGGKVIAIEAAPVARQLEPYFREHSAVPLNQLAKVLRTIPSVVTGPAPMRFMRAGDLNIAFVPLAHPGATEMDHPDGWWYHARYRFDPNRYARGKSLVIREPGALSVEIWDPVKGTRSTPITRQTPEGTRVDLAEDVSPAFFLVWQPGAASSSLPASRWEKALTLPASGWTSVVEPTIDNQYGDLSFPAHEGAPAVQTWSFKHRIGDAEIFPWKKCDSVIATYGCQGWWRGPVASVVWPEIRKGKEWKPAIYSLSRGIRNDSLHGVSLGPSGHVPEAFLDFGTVKAGESVQFGTWIWQEAPARLHLAIGAPGRKQARINGEMLPDSGREYLWMTPVDLPAGWNRIEWQFTTAAECRGRCYWALVTAPERFRRPECLTSADSPKPESLLLFSQEFELPFDATAGKILVYAAGASRLLLDGVETGRQGGFMPYSYNDVAVIWPLGPLAKGGHRIELHVIDGDQPVRAMVDAEWQAADGQKWELNSGAEWSVSRDGGAPQSAGLNITPGSLEPSALARRRWPHPLPRAHWLESNPADGTVADVQPHPFAGEKRVEWFQWTIPPGAVAMRLPVQGAASLCVDETPVEVSGEVVRLPGWNQPARRATLRLETENGSTGGGLFHAPVTYEMAEGKIDLGNWAEQGLESYSGGLRYRTTLHLAGVAENRWAIDLGKVRGTAEVWINGRSAGVRFLSPYRFEVTGLLVSGENQLEVLILNTLASYHASHGPGQVLEYEQRISGLFGPVCLLRGLAR